MNVLIFVFNTFSYFCPEISIAIVLYSIHHPIFFPNCNSENKLQAFMLLLFVADLIFASLSTVTIIINMISIIIMIKL